MGIRERQERDREAVRRSILDAARELFVVEGYQNVSIRKIAERIEYSPAAIYGYFHSKDDIFFSLAEEGFRLLGHPSAIASLPTLAPIDRIRAIFWHLYKFSREQPQYFALMFVDRSVPRISREYERFAFAREMKQEVIAEIERCIALGALPATIDARAAMRALGAGVLGVAVMRVSDRLAPDEDPDKMASNVLELTLAGLKSCATLEPITYDSCPLADEPVPAGGTPQKASEGGTPDERSGGGAPDKTSGGGAPEKTSGGGTPERTSGGGTPERTSGGGTPERTSWSSR